MIIDMHTHIFPDALAHHAMDVLQKARVVNDCFPTKAELLKSMERNSVDCSVVLHVATKETQHEDVLNFAAEIESGKLLSFGSVMPDSVSALEYIWKISDAGMKGLKFHPPLQRFKPEEARFFPLYDLARALNLITVFHTGWDPSYPNEIDCSPASIVEIERNFPGLKIVAAHMGGLKMSLEVLNTLAGHNVYLDTAWCAEPWMDVKTMESIIARHGVEKVLFGSDYPWHNQKSELELIDSLCIPQSDKERILGQNAAELLRLE